MYSCYECGKTMNKTRDKFIDEVKGETFELEVDCVKCSDCGYKTITPNQMEGYDVAFADAYRAKHNLLTTEELLEYRKEVLNFTQEQFANFTGASLRSIKRWEHGCVQDKAMDDLIRLKIEKRFEKAGYPGQCRKNDNALDLSPVSTAAVIAKYILSYFREIEVSITQMKLHKLLYYSQGNFIGTFNRLLFPERIEAWAHGPVVSEIYPVYRDFGNNPIDTDSEYNNELPQEVELFLADVIRIYGSKTASQLRKMTHSEAPWVYTRKGLPEDEGSNKEITPQSMKNFFCKKQ